MRKCTNTSCRASENLVIFMHYYFFGMVIIFSNTASLLTFITIIFRRSWQHVFFHWRRSMSFLAFRITVMQKTGTEIISTESEIILWKFVPPSSSPPVQKKQGVRALPNPKSGHKVYAQVSFRSTPAPQGQRRKVGKVIFKEKTIDVSARFDTFWFRVSIRTNIWI